MDNPILKKICKICTLKLLKDYNDLQFVYMDSLHKNKCESCGEKEVNVDYVNPKDVEDKNAKH